MNDSITYHPLLLKQLKKYLGESEVIPEEFNKFMKAVNDSYFAYERDNKLHEHAFALAEQEYEEINQRLADEIEKRDKAEQYSAAKNVFLANISHEIRTPMNAILGLVRQMLKMEIPEKVEELLWVVEDASDHLLGLLNDLLDVSKIESGRIELEHVDFDLIHTIQHTLSIFRLKAEEKGLTLKTSLGVEQPIWVRGDAFRFKQVIINLLSNAIKFTEQGKVELKLNHLEEFDDSIRFTLSVTDTGKGMSEQFQKELFQRFTQEDVSSVRKVGGTGLGMTITREIIQLMGGEITVDSALNRGSTFLIQLQLPKGNPLELSGLKQTTLNQMGLLKGKSILIAEDNAWNQKVLELLLDKMSAQYNIVSNGQEAVEALSDQKYDLVLMDVQMPVMDGYSASKKIRNDLKDLTPIIALTASAQRGEREKCIQFGMNDYLSKPFTEEELKATIFKNISLDSNQTEDKPLKAMEQSQALYDLQSIRELADGDEDFIETMVEMFKEESGKMLDEMRSALSEANIDQVGKVAHKLKPTIDQFGISSLQDEVREIEKYDRQGSIEALKEKVHSFDQQLRAIASEMKA